MHVILGQQFDSAAMQRLTTAIKIRTHRNFRPTVSTNDHASMQAAALVVLLTDRHLTAVFHILSWADAT